MRNMRFLLHSRKQILISQIQRANKFFKARYICRFGEKRFREERNFEWQTILIYISNTTLSLSRKILTKEQDIIQ